MPMLFAWAASTARLQKYKSFKPIVKIFMKELNGEYSLMVVLLVSILMLLFVGCVNEHRRTKKMEGESRAPRRLCERVFITSATPQEAKDLFGFLLSGILALTERDTFEKLGSNLSRLRVRFVLIRNWDLWSETAFTRYVENHVWNAGESSPSIDFGV